MDGQAPDGQTRGSTPVTDLVAPRRFRTALLVPAQARARDRRQTLIAQTLFSEPRHFGYLVMEYRGDNPSMMTSLRHQLSAALLNVALAEEANRQRDAIKEALERATESERRYRELALFLPTIIMETDQNGNITFLNNVGKAAFDLDDAELAARPSLAGFFGGLAPKPTALGGNTASYQKLHIHTKAGKDKTFLVKGAADPDHPGQTRWNGIDFLPIISSLAHPDADLFAEYGLSKREEEILTLCLAGLLGKEIAHHLNLSLSTVKGHIGSIYRKTGVGSRDQLFERVRGKMIDNYGYDTLVFSLIAQLLRD
jgi:DNA-binding CsgD family transcriptional regulator